MNVYFKCGVHEEPYNINGKMLSYDRVKETVTYGRVTIEVEKSDIVKFSEYRRGHAIIKAITLFEDLLREAMA